MRGMSDRSRVVELEPPFLAGANARKKAAPALTFDNIHIKKKNNTKLCTNTFFTTKKWGLNSKEL